MKRYLMEDKRRKHGRWRLIDQETLKDFEEIESAQDVVPAIGLSFDFVWNDFSQTTRASGISPIALGLPERIIAGEMIGDDDLDGVLIHEFLAYQMGFATQSELDSLIGSEITAVFENRKNESELAVLLRALENGDLHTALEEQKELLTAVKAVVGEADLRSLTDTQKRLVRSSLKAVVPTASENTTDIARTFKIKGVYHSMGETDLFSIFKRFMLDPAQPVLFHYTTATQLQFDSGGKKNFYSATVYVDSFKSLQPVETKIQKLGFRTSSARDMLSEIDRRIDEISQVIYFIALCVLIITAVAISNALIVSVMERTFDVRRRGAAGRCWSRVSDFAELLDWKTRTGLSSAIP